jgi:hypothetical protein
METGEDRPGRRRQEGRTTRGGTPTITRAERTPAPRQRTAPESAPDRPARQQGRADRRVPPQFSSATVVPQDRPGKAAQDRPRKAPHDRPRKAPQNLADQNLADQNLATPKSPARTPRTAPLPKVPEAPKAPQGRPSPGQPVTERPRAAAHGPAAGAAQRMPFLLLVCGLLGGALLSALVISTTLAQGSFQINQLQQQDSQLARQRQQLENQVASAGSAQVIEEEAYQLGMRPVGLIRFLDIKDGQIKTDAGTGAESRINVPGYTP